MGDLKSEYQNIETFLRGKGFLGTAVPKIYHPDRPCFITYERIEKKKGIVLVRQFAGFFAYAYSNNENSQTEFNQEYC